MQETLRNFEYHGTPVDPTEHLAAMVAALLHDIGHGPFSHSLESELIPTVNHEAIGQAVMAQLEILVEDPEARAAVARLPFDMALQMLQGTYERPFFHHLLVGQMDLDRLDYLLRDSHFTGVVEGRVGAGRILKTMRVVPTQGGADSRLVILEKGFSAVENMLLARRLMYSQVYLHKAVVAGDQVLRATLRRARALLSHGNTRSVKDMSPALRYFLEREWQQDDWKATEVLRRFLDVDDEDILYSLKRWQESSDPILKDLARRFIDRDLFRCVFLAQPPDCQELRSWQSFIASALIQRGMVDNVKAMEAATYYMPYNTANHTSYEAFVPPIRILGKGGKDYSLAESADAWAIAALTSFTGKPYVCMPKEFADELNLH